MNSGTNKTSLYYLFITFLKIGSISFGGFMSLVAVIQDEMVKKKRRFSEDLILEGIGLASIMPGPLAVNVVTFLGFMLKGMRGALLSMFAVIFPSFALVLVLSVLYFEYGDLSMATKFFDGIMPGVIAIIISVAFGMAKKSIADFMQVLICILSGLLLFFFGGFMLTMALILAGGLSGWLAYAKQERIDHQKAIPAMKHPLKQTVFFLGGAALILSVIIIMPYIFAELPETVEMLRELVLIFSGMSLSLFGGGYVFIPAMQEVIVDQLGWLSVREFSDAIAVGQITPGPILISACFIGYKVSGIPGAILATMAIFLPSGLLMILGSHFLDTLRGSYIFKSIFKGVRPAVIGMIFSAAVKMGFNLTLNWQVMVLFLAVFLLHIRFNISATILIPLSGLLGLVIL
ncbi:MAG: chromate efflux transporter [Cytophagales bacterium]|nr:chromate efflux transporter [Cytophagales bacterium]